MGDRKVVTLDRLKLVLYAEVSEAVAQYIGQGQWDVDVSAVRSFARDGLAVRLVAVLAGRQAKQVSATYPTTWWDAVKDRWLSWVPGLPIHYTTVTLTARELYPDLALPDRTPVFNLAKHMRGETRFTPN